MHQTTLSKLSDRAAQAEKNVAAVKGKRQAALKAQADAARKSAATQASSLQKDTAAAGGGAKAKAALSIEPIVLWLAAGEIVRCGDPGEACHFDA